MHLSVKITIGIIWILHLHIYLFVTTLVDFHLKRVLSKKCKLWRGICKLRHGICKLWHGTCKAMHESSKLSYKLVNCCVKLASCCVKLLTCNMINFK